MLILINKDTFIIEKVFIDDTNSIGRIRAILEINSDSILCGCSEGRMCLYHIKENAIDIQSKCHSKNISDSNHFISSSWDSSIKIWKF